MMTKLKKSGVRALTLFLTVLMALQLSAVITFATPADECDHEYTYDLQFDFYELNYTTGYICLQCYDAFYDDNRETELSYHLAFSSCYSYTSGKILTSITHYTAYAYDVEGFEEYEGEISDGGVLVDDAMEGLLTDDDGNYISAVFGRNWTTVYFDEITTEEISVTAEPVTGQFYSSNGYTGLSAAWALWDGTSELTDTEAATLTETKTMYYYSTGSNKYYPFSGYEKPWTGETILTKTCIKCGRVAVSDGCVHDYDDGVVTAKATCTKDGSMTYTCSDCGFSYTTSIKATGHTARNAVKENVVDAACTTDGSYDSVVYCETCGEELSRETVTVSKTGHTADSAVTENYVAATCTKDGSYDAVVYCKTCGVEMSRTTTTVAATGHNYTSSVTKAATCTTAGTRTYTCSKCGDSYSESIPATGHNYTSSVTKAATCTTAGTRTYTCSCGDTYTESIPATGHTWNEGVVTTAATHSATGVKTYTCTNCGATKTETIAKVTFLFDDVKDSSAYYYDAVYWAYDNGITTGTSTTMFSPSAGCTRAQFVTFLYRLAGEPAPTTTSCKFTDVSSSGYYYNAVLWAAANGVTEGTTSTTFSPNAKITRAQAVTMIYRYAGSPSVSTTNPFTDTSSSAYYYNAMLWAVKNGITSGTTKTTFSPNTTCSRAMMVTFLYRFAG